MAIDLTPGQVLGMILVPRAMAAMMPSMLSQFVVILKGTSLSYVISYPELLAETRRFSPGEGNILQILLLVAALFIVIRFSLTTLAEWLTRYLSNLSTTAIKKADLVPCEVDNPNPPTMQIFKLPKR